MPAMPTLFDPTVVRASDVELGGARLWELTARASDTEIVLVPDLSRDVLWLDEAPGSPPVLNGPVNGAAVVPLLAGPASAGLRLPPEAFGIQLDAAWSGWKDLARAGTRADALRLAIADGAVSWRTDPERARLLDALNAPGVRLADVVDRLDASERTIRRRTEASFGLSPVAIARILRLRRFVSEVRGSSFAGAAADSGFADQAHAAREVRAYSGLTTRELARFALAD